MAKSDAVWAIDIGQCALKALRCRPHENPNQLQAVAFDFIEYPKVLSQPDADAPALVAEALRQFLSRNTVRGDRVFITVPGQNGLARFIKLPPVEVKKIPDIVKYEAKQQIPFPLDEVVYRHQRMAGGSLVEGFAMETEVGLFAMKRDQAFRALKPFQEAGIEVDCIQLTPLALYNFVAFDQLTDLPAPEDYDVDNPPDSVVLLSLGTDTADLVVTNGFRVWQRSLPIGGNHFTKALTKELKLTYASAELQKRNALNAEDTKTLFQAMRPVFNDLLTEVTRSINYFTNLDKKARVKRGLALGNAMKLPGLQRYLAQNLGFDLDRVESFRGLVGPVVESPVFKENLLSFGPCYGLAIQALRDPKIDVNLVPDEIRNDRLIRAKKPWMVGAAAVLLLGITANFASHYRTVASVRLTDSSGKPAEWGPVVDQTKKFLKQAKEFRDLFDEATSKYLKTDIVGANLQVSVEGRRRWLEILQAINACLPNDPDWATKPVEERIQIHLTSIESMYLDKVETWYDASARGITEVAQSTAASSKEGEASTAPAEAPVRPTGPGWVFRVTGYHFHNTSANESYVTFVKNRFAKNFLKPEVEVTTKDKDGQVITEMVRVKKLGILHPALIDLGSDNKFQIEIEEEIVDAKSDDEKGNAANAAQGAARPGDVESTGTREIVKSRFALEFLWIEPPKEKVAKEKDEAASPAAQPAAQPAATQPAAAQPAATQPATAPNGEAAKQEQPTSPPADPTAPEKGAANPTEPAADSPAPAPTDQPPAEQPSDAKQPPTEQPPAEQPSDAKQPSPAPAP